MYFSCDELKYKVGGKQAQADIVRTYEHNEVGRRGRSREKLAVEYRFKDDGGAERKETDTVAVDWDVPTDRKVAIEYRDDRSRIAGNGRMLWVWIFLGSLGVLGFMGFRFWQEVSEATRPTSRSSRR